MKNLFYNISIFTLFLTGFLVLLVAYWLLHPFKTITINTNILPTDKMEYTAGETLIYTLDYCKYIKNPVSISRAFIDGVVYSMPDITASNPCGCNVMKISVQVPNLPSGVYKMKVSYTYHINPLRDITTTVYTNAFKIL